LDISAPLGNGAHACYIAAQRFCAQNERAMSLVVKLEDDLGEHGEWVILHAVIPNDGGDSFPLLNGIDPFGKTVFNHRQMDEFLREWEQVKTRVRDESQMEAWQRVKQMAETCRQDRDLYLRFVGN
jgi:hypothetical protein